MGFTYKGIHSDDKGITVETINNPILPAIKTISYTPQWQHGTMDYSFLEGKYFYEDKIVEMLLKIRADTISDLYSKCKDMALWLTGAGKLVFDEKPDRYYSARVLQGIDFVPKIFGRYAELTVQFRVYPFAEGTGCVYVGGLSAGESRSVTIDNEGDVPTAPIITLTEGTSGKFVCNELEFDGLLNNTVIDNANKEIYIGDEYITADSNLKFFELPTGTSSIVIKSSVDVCFNVRVKTLYF